MPWQDEDVSLSTQQQPLGAEVTLDSHTNARSIMHEDKFSKQFELEQ